MEKLSSKLGLLNGQLVHYCPACNDLHFIPIFGEYKTLWIMNGKVNVPGVSPSVKLGDSNKPTCHYILEKGFLNYCNDTTHKYTNQVIPLPDIPDHYWQKHGS